MKGSAINKLRSISIHVLICGLFLVLPFLVSPDKDGRNIDQLFANTHFRKILLITCS